jgi:hypothetical protein
MAPDVMPRCGTRDGFDLMPSTRKDGKPRKVNSYPINCEVCNRLLQPGEAVIEWKPKRRKYIGFCS